MGFGRTYHATDDGDWGGDIFESATVAVEYVSRRAR